MVRLKVFSFNKTNDLLDTAEKNETTSSVVCDNVFKCTEHCADGNSSSAMSVVISRRFLAPYCTECYGPPVQKIVRQVCAKATDTRTQSKAQEVNIDNCGQFFLTPEEITMSSTPAFSE